MLGPLCSQYLILTFDTKTYFTLRLFNTLPYLIVTQTYPYPKYYNNSFFSFGEMPHGSSGVDCLTAMGQQT